MKNYATALICLITMTLATGQDTTKIDLVTLTVQLSGIASDKGEVLVALYDSKKGWLSTLYKGAESKIVDGKATVTFTEVPSGTYGISAFHDKNSNDKLDTNFLGIPKEDYACSRGAKGMFGPPKWKDAVFDTQKTNVINVNF